MIEIKKVLIPYWVEKALKRHNVELSGVLDYSRAKPVLSIEDLLSLELMQSVVMSEDLSTLKMEYFCGDLFTCWLDTANEADKADILALRRNQQAYSNEPYSYLVKRITAVNMFDEVYPSPNAKEEDYRIVDLGRNVVGVVVYRGFFNAMLDQDKRAKFLSDFTKRHFTYMTIPDVSMTGVFKDYLVSLSKQHFQVSTV